MTQRRASWCVVLVGASTFVLLAWWLVPWQPVPWAVTPVPAGDVFTPEEIARAEQHARWARVWSWSGLVVGLVVAALLARSAGGDRVAALLELVPDRGWLRAAAAVVLFTAVVWVTGLPFTLAGWWLRREVGLSTQSWSGVLVDGLRWQAIAAATTVVMVLGWRILVRRLPRAWPVPAAALAALVTLLASWAWPVLVEPVFNDFTSLPDGSLRSGVLELAEREGVAVDDVLVSDASRRTTALNAYVSGFGGTRRVVLYDTLVEQESEPVVLSVTAHEIAHAEHDDPLVGSLLGAAGAAVGVGLLGVVLSAGRVRRRWGSPGDPASVVLTLALLSFAALATAPVSSGISRAIEARADVTAIDATRDPDTFEELQRRLAVANVSDPTPPRWSQWAFGSHPTALQRIAIARAWSG